MELYETPLDVVRAVFEVMFCAAIVWNFVGELLEMRAVGVGAYLADGWNIVDAARLSLQVAIAAIWVRIISHPQRLDLQLSLPAGDNTHGYRMGFYVQIRDIENRELARFLNGETSIEDALATIEAEGNELLARFAQTVN